MRSQFTIIFRSIWGVPVLAILILLLGLGITSGIYHLVGDKNDAIAQARFDSYKALLVSGITHRLDDYAQVLYGAAGLFKSSDEVNYRKWKEYVDSLQMDKYYPGLESIGYVSMTPDKDGSGKLKPSILYEEPINALGKEVFKPDSGSTSIRLKAMDEARDQNNVAITKKIALVQQPAGEQELGFLMLLPVYQHGASLDTLEQRRQSLRGYVFNVFTSKDFMKEVTELFDEYMDVNVYEGPNPTSNDLIYKSIPHDPLEKPDFKLKAESHLLVGNHIWSLFALAKQKEGDSLFPGNPTSVLAFGILISLIFATMTWVLLSHRVQMLNPNINATKMSAKRDDDEKHLSMFFAKIFHELRTPLNSIMVLSKVLSDNNDKNLTSKQIEQANVIHQSGEELLEMINEVMSLSQIRSGKLIVHYDKIDIVEFSELVRQSFERIVESKLLSLKVSVDKSLPRFIYNDHKKIYQIIKNLCSNALKFTEKGSITIRFYKPDMADAIAISVTDTGRGIPRAKITSLFEEYNQANEDVVTKQSGAGLGLPISQELAHMLGGEIQVTSEELMGSCFTVFLPINSSLKGGQ
ncbi:MAG: CHASE domain-containing protein [Gammaproteobacteria bacterium]